MNTTALFLSTALALFNAAPDAKPGFAELSALAASAAAVQEAEPASAQEAEPPAPAPESASESEAQPQSEPMRQAVEPQRERVEPGADPLAEPETVSAADTLAQTQAGARRAADWFAGLETLSARFVQTAPDGAVSEGAVSLQRPGRARFDYDDPSPILLVADGATVAIADFQLETIDRAPIRNTPLRFLLSGADELDEAVTEAGRSNGRLYVTLADPGGEVDGRLTLVFDDPDPSAPAGEMALLGWFAVDAMGGLTEVTLSETERGVSFDPRLFILDDEDVMADDRRTRRR